MLTDQAVKVGMQLYLEGLSVMVLQPVVCLLYCMLYMQFYYVGPSTERLLAETRTGPHVQACSSIKGAPHLMFTVLQLSVHERLLLLLPGVPLLCHRLLVLHEQALRSSLSHANIQDHEEPHFINNKPYSKRILSFCLDYIWQD